MRDSILCLIIVLGSTYLPSTSQSQELPHWIWNDLSNTPTQPGIKQIRFQKTIDVPSQVVAARLRCSGHAAGLKVQVNGHVAADLEPYDPLAYVDVTEFVSGGECKIEATAKPSVGPSAFFIRLDFTLQDGSTKTLVTDSSWHTDSGRAHSFGQVQSSLIVDQNRRVETNATDNYDQWKIAKGERPRSDPAKFQLAPGFEIQQVRSAQKGEDSWVSLAVDPQGRLIVAKEKEGLLRMTLSDDGSNVVQVESIENTLKECRGLLFVDDVLYANANNSKGLYRMTPSQSDGYLAPELVYASGGGVGHGRNDLALGPDGMIYSIHGDSVHLPTEAIDYTSPLREAHRGQKTSEGHLIRIDPDSGRVELLAAGLRNPFGIDFNADGEAFTYDADAEYDMGAPWYRPTRVVHLVPGADYGWRGVTKSWPPYYPDQPEFLRAGLDMGRGSPTAVKFGTRSHFPPTYKDALYILDWTYGRIIAVHMMPRGASYLMVGETFLKGRPLNVTDLDFTPDGSMYFVTGGRKTHSTLYRVRYTGQQEQRGKESEFETAVREQASASRHQRRRFETPKWNAKLATQADALLGDDRPLVQYAARTFLENTLTPDSSNNAGLAGRLQRLLILARSNGPDLAGSIVRDLPIEQLGGASRSKKLTAIRLLQLANEFNPEIRYSPRFQKAIAELFPDRLFLVNRALTSLVSESNSWSLVPITMNLLRNEVAPVKRMQYMFALRNFRKGWTPKLRMDFFKALNSTDDFSGGEGMRAFLAKIREEAVGTLTEQERVDLGKLTSANTEQTPTRIREPREFVRKWKVEDFDFDVEHNASAQRGKKLFADALCVNCHRCSEQGTFVGPDLTSVGQRFRKVDMLTSILQPSLVISEKYRSLKVVTSDGKAYIGQIAIGGDYRSTKIRLATDPNHPFKTVEIDKSGIESKEFSDVSWMPSGLLDTFSRQDILDLLAYLQDPTIE